MSRVSCAIGDALFLRQVAEGAHVMEAIGELDQDDADVIHHRQQHLAEVLGLPFLARGEPNRADLGHPFHDMGHFRAEELADAVDGGQRVFDNVVQQPGRDRHRIELHVCQKVRNGKWMNQIGLTRVANLAAVLEGGKHVGPAEQLDVGIRAVSADFFQQIFEANHENRCLTCRLWGGAVQMIARPGTANGARAQNARNP